jgi:cytochrome c5
MKLIAVALMLLAQDLPVEQTKKNIKVLQGTPSSQLIPVMAFMANSLGVTCGHCHGKEFASDEKPAKDAARKMIALQRAINAQHYGGKVVVTCNTCHAGRVLPAATPDVADSGWNARPAATPFTPGEEALARIPAVTARSLVVRGTVERYNGRDEPKSAPFTLTVDGESLKYETELSHPPEAKRAMTLYVVQRPKREQLHGERWTVSPTAVRRMRETPTPLGPLPEAMDWTDFRDTPAGRLPFRAQWSRADYRVTYTIEEVR